MKYILAIIFLISSYVSIGQTYNPAQGTVSNKPYAPGQAVPTDSRSYFYDATNFLWRPYQSTTEVLSYLNLSKYRTGHFSIYVNPTGTLNGNGTFTGGTIAEYWFKNGTANGNLVLKQDSTKSNQSALVDTASAIRSVMSARFNPIAGTNMTITGTYPNLTFNASGGGGAVSITANTATGARVTPSPITGSGVISNDTFTVATRSRIQKVVDSLDYYQDTLFVSNTFTAGVPLTFTNIDYDSIFVKRLVAGTDIAFVQNADSSVTINASTGGEANTASNVGAGSGWWKQKTGVDLEFKSVIANTGLTATANTNDVTLKADTATLSTIAQTQKRLNDSMSVIRTFIGSNVYELKDTLTAQSGAFFCYVKSTSGTYEKSCNVLKIGSVTNDDKRTITINAVVYIDSDVWVSAGGGGNGWVIIATLPSAFRPTGMLSFPISQSVPLTSNSSTTPHRAADATTGITSSVNGTNTGAAMGYIDADGNVAVKIVSVTDYGVLSGDNVLVIPIVVTYFINVNS